MAGGIILFINIILYFIFFNLNENLISAEIIFKNLNELNHFFLTSFLIFLIGFIDDKKDLNPNKKFLFLIIILGQFIFFNQFILIKSLELSFMNNSYNLGSYSYIFTLFCFLVFLNAFNMFDGMNLQSSSYSLIIIVYFINFNINSILIYFLFIFIFILHVFKLF